MEFRDRLKELRRQKHITQETLGRAIHVSRSLIAKWEAGLGLPSETSLIALCEYFNVEKSKLVPDLSSEEIFVEKNLKINQHKRRFCLLLATLLILLCSFFVFQAYRYQIKMQREEEKQFLQTLTPTAKKIFFEHPNTINVEKDVAFDKGTYLLEADCFVKLYFDTQTLSSL